MINDKYLTVWYVFSCIYHACCINKWKQSFRLSCLSWSRLIICMYVFVYRISSDHQCFSRTPMAPTLLVHIGIQQMTFSDSAAYSLFLQQFKWVLWKHDSDENKWYFSVSIILLLLSMFSVTSSEDSSPDCSSDPDPELCPRQWALEHRWLLTKCLF